MISFKSVRRLIGLSLIETAIVLGIVGVAAGGVWVATGSVRAKHRYDTAYAEGLRITSALARVIKRGQYPSTNYTVVDITQSTADIGILPSGYRIFNLAAAGVDAFVSPSGLTGTVFLTQLPTGPVIGYTLYTTEVPAVTQGLDNAGCMQMVARFVQADSRIVPEVWVSKINNLRFEVFTLPANIMGYQKCPNNTSGVTMMVRP